MDRVYVGDGMGDGYGSSDGESMGDLVGMFIMDIDFLSDWWLERWFLFERHM